MDRDVKHRRAKSRSAGAMSFPLLLVAMCLLGTLAGAAKASLFCAYQPDNFNRAARKLPADMRRVLVLPVTSDSSYEQTESTALLYDILVEELSKSKKFEVIRLTPAELKMHTGKPAWRAEDALPPTLLDTLGKEFACNGVIFAHLTAYQSQAPLAIGWRLKLVDARDGTILWSVDEVFDAGRPDVVAGVKIFDRREQKSDTDDDHWLTLHSPRRFGRYAAASVLRLLPVR